MELPSNPPGLRLYARFGDGAEYTDVGGFIELTDELTNLGIREIWRNGMYGVGADGYEGWNYISLYYGTDVETPEQEYGDELLAYTNNELKKYWAKKDPPEPEEVEEEKPPVVHHDYLADLSWLVSQAYKAPPGWWKKGDGKRMDRLQDLFTELNKNYERVPSPFERK